MGKDNFFQSFYDIKRQNTWFMNLYAYWATFTLISLRYHFGKTVDWDTSYISLHCTVDESKVSFWVAQEFYHASTFLYSSLASHHPICVSCCMYVMTILYLSVSFSLSCDVFPLFLIVGYRNLEPFHCNV